LLAASALTIEPCSRSFFFAYLVLVPCVLVLFLLRREVGANGAHRLEEEAFASRRCFASLAARTVVPVRLDAGRLHLFPRHGGRLLRSSVRERRSRTGFSERGRARASVAALKQDDAVALRVIVDHPELFQERVYWRGAAARSVRRTVVWKRRAQEMRPLLRPEPGIFAMPGAATRGPLVNEEIILEPQDSADDVFAGKARARSARLREVWTDPLGNLRVIRRQGPHTLSGAGVALAPTNPATERNVSCRRSISRIGRASHAPRRMPRETTRKGGRVLDYLPSRISLHAEPGGSG